MEDLLKLIEIMQSVKKHLSWAVLVPYFFITTALLLIFQLLSIHIRLEPMYSTVRITTVMLCLLSFADYCTKDYLSYALGSTRKRKYVLFLQK